MKYLDFLRDRYFDAADIDERHRVRFALAAYNALAAADYGSAGKGWEERTRSRQVVPQRRYGGFEDRGAGAGQDVSNIDKYYIIFKGPEGRGKANVWRLGIDRLLGLLTRR